MKQKPLEVAITSHPKVLFRFGKVLEEPASTK